MLMPLLAAALAAPRDTPISPALRALADEQPVVQVVLEVDGDDADAWLRDAGVEIQARAGSWRQVEVRSDELDDLARVPGLRRARLPVLASPKEVRTQGYEAIFADGDWQDEGLRGRGVTVAILDVGFAGYEDLLGTELPRRVELGGSATGTESTHGVAVAEIVHDLAPKADLLLYTFRTDVEFLAAFESLTEVDVVNASVGFDDVWPADGTSPFSQAVTGLVGQGVAWVGAAGNENERYRVGALTDEDGDGDLEIDGLEGVWVTAPGGQAQVRLRWSEPMDDAQVDVDLELREADGSLCAASTNPQDGSGSSPLEAASGWCTGDRVLAVPVLAAAADLSGLDAWLYGVYGIEDDAHSGTMNLTLPADAEGALAVGACDLSTGEAAPYSSRGPTEDGRQKPDLCAPSVADTATLDAFEGTSAASPHAAGLAALLIQAEGLSGAELTEALRDRAQDVGDPGWDPATGAGTLRAGPVPPGCHCAAAPSPPSIALAGLLCLALIRRRQGRNDLGTDLQNVG